MTAPSDPPVWLLLILLAVGVLVPVAIFAVLWHFMLKFFHWLGGKIVALAPAPYGRWFVGIVRFYYVAAMFCGLTAFGVSFAILGAPFPETLGDPVLRDPLLWLTWLAVMAGIMIAGVTVGVLLRDALARLRKGLDGNAQ